MDPARRPLFASACLFAVVLSLLVANDVSARSLGESRMCIEALLTAAVRPTRVAAWAAHLEGVEVGTTATQETAVVRFYESDGDVDEGARALFERIAARGEDPHPLAVRLEQLVFKAAYHFKNAPVVVVSGWRANAGRHGTAEALDFKLRGVPSRSLAAYLRGLPRAGVGVYTHPRTQYVHLDVREPSFHWIDASPPGVKWREAQLGDRTCAKRDASWVPEMDLP
jgi:uncharacterized protein YcbK (DUF882 family)